VKTGRFWESVSQKTTFLFLAVAILSVFTLIWMGMRLIQQDRVLETRQLEDNREAAADRLIVALDQLLSIEERKLAETQTDNFLPHSDDYLIVSMDFEEILAFPEKALLYYPFIPPPPEQTPQLFKDAENAEFRDMDYDRAIAILRPLQRSTDRLTQANAKLRLARNQRKAGRLEDALLTYQDLVDFAGIPAVLISGIPIDLIARRARCALFEELDDHDRLHNEAKRLNDELAGRRWRLDRATYLITRSQVERWLQGEFQTDQESKALAEAVTWLWENLATRSRADSKQDDQGRTILILHEQAITVLWRRVQNRLKAIIAGPVYQKNTWFDTLFSSADFSAVNVSLNDSRGELVYGDMHSPEIPFTSRAGLVSGLPWDIHVISADLEADLSQFAQRRRIMAGGLGILALLVIAVSYLIARAVSRELAAARLQADFVSAVSHEFRTPLTSMRQFTEMLSDNESLSDAKRKTYYDAQARATSRLSRLVESLLDFGRMEAGARPYRLEPVDIGMLARDVVHEYQQELGSSSSRIGCDAPKKGPMVMADRDALAQALWNLVDNAVKYSPDGQDVQVDVTFGQRISIKVRDKGIGIPSAEISRIRGKFVRGSNTRDQDVKGTGIGLAVVDHILSAHHGELRIESEPGQGSTFEILLPKKE
jgi:signal transduction histidine kinase